MRAPDSPRSVLEATPARDFEHPQNENVAHAFQARPISEISLIATPAIYSDLHIT